MISGCATVLMADVVKPLRPRMSDTNATIVTKVLTVVVGIVSVIFVIFAKNFGYTLISVGILYLHLNLQHLRCRVHSL